MISDTIVDDTKLNSKAPSAVRTIGEVADELGVAQHVLRFWESKFPQIQPIKRRRRRYYRPEDIELLYHIKAKLYDEGFTIKGVQKLLKQQGKPTQEDFFTEQAEEEDEASASPPPQLSSLDIQKIETILARLERLKEKIEG